MSKLARRGVGGQARISGVGLTLAGLNQIS